MRRKVYNGGMWPIEKGSVVSVDKYSLANVDASNTTEIVGMAEDTIKACEWGWVLSSGPTGLNASMSDWISKKMEEAIEKDLTRDLEYPSVREAPGAVDLTTISGPDPDLSRRLNEAVAKIMGDYKPTQSPKEMADIAMAEGLKPGLVSSLEDTVNEMAASNTAPMVPVQYPRWTPDAGWVGPMDPEYWEAVIHEATLRYPAVREAFERGSSFLAWPILDQAVGNLPKVIPPAGVWARLPADSVRHSVAYMEACRRLDFFGAQDVFGYGRESVRRRQLATIEVAYADLAVRVSREAVKVDGLETGSRKYWSRLFGRAMESERFRAAFRKRSSRTVYLELKAALGAGVPTVVAPHWDHPLPDDIETCDTSLHFFEALLVSSDYAADNSAAAKNKDLLRSTEMALRQRHAELLGLPTTTETATATATATATSPAEEDEAMDVTKEEQLSEIEALKARLAKAELDLARERTIGERLKSGAATAAQAVGKGAAAGTLTLTNKMARDAILGQFENLPQWATEGPVHEGMLFVPPALIYALAELADFFEVDIPGGTRLVRGAALYGFQGAGYEGSQAAAELLFEKLGPILKAYAAAGAQLDAVGALPDTPQWVEQTKDSARAAQALAAVSDAGKNL